MSQDTIFEILRIKRLSGDHSYFSAEQIRDMLKDKGLNIYRSNVYHQLSQLRIFGYLDLKTCSGKRNGRLNMYVSYRLKKDYL